jgi:hypothetical protein
MKRVNFSTPERTDPAWAGDYLDRNTLVPGGAKVDASEFTADSEGRKYIQSGTLLGRTYVERDAGTGFGPADTATPDDEIFLLAFDVSDATFEDDCELYRHNSLVKENLLPDYATYNATDLAVLRSLYQCTTGYKSS